MIDECPSGFAGPSLRHDTSRVQLLFPACGVLGTLLPSGPKVTTQKWSYWILWTCTSAPLNLTSSADSEVHPLCCLTQGIPQRPRSTGSCSVSLSPDVLKTEKGPQWPMPDRLSSAPGLHRRGHAELPCSQRPGAPGAPALLWTVVCAQEDLLPAGAGHAEVGSRGGAGRKDAEPRKGGEACACPAPATLHAPRAQSGKLRWRWWRAPVSGAEDGETRYLRGPPEQAE
ncbi:uncharacterized protein [Manis javanica]